MIAFRKTSLILAGLAFWTGEITSLFASTPAVLGWGVVAYRAPARVTALADAHGTSQDVGQRPHTFDEAAADPGDHELDVLPHAAVASVTPNPRPTALSVQAAACGANGRLPR